MEGLREHQRCSEKQEYRTQDLLTAQSFYYTVSTRVSVRKLTAGKHERSSQIEIRRIIPPCDVYGCTCNKQYAAYGGE